MPIPKPAQLAKHEADIEKYSKMLTEEGFIPEKKLVQMIRSSLRQTWMRNPVKLLKLNQAKKPDMNPATKTMWLYECEHCHNDFKLADIEVDHIHGNHSFTELEDFFDYVENILNVTVDDLQILCKPCHELKTYMEANPHLSKEEAELAKSVLAWFRKRPKVPQQKKQLELYGYKGACVSNDEKRKAIVLELIREGVITT